MEKFTQLTGVAAPLPMVNIDTDMIIPARFLKSIKRDGFGPSLFYPLRYDEKGNERPDFVLNQPAYRKAKVLIAGRNFGCGSSREHAPWALDNFGIRCVIAPDFADIFFNNASKNGMLLIKLPQDVCDELTKDAENGANATFSIDLEKQEITRPDGQKVKFEIDPHKKYCLLNGLDDIGLTLKKDDKIAGFEKKQKVAQPWV
jgi:3-isopropylmalate/(R)-2-methylmalate dehydratase small subunit